MIYILPFLLCTMHASPSTPPTPQLSSSFHIPTHVRVPPRDESRSEGLMGIIIGTRGTWGGGGGGGGDTHTLSLSSSTSTKELVTWPSRKGTPWHYGVQCTLLLIHLLHRPHCTDSFCFSMSFSLSSLHLCLFKSPLQIPWSPEAPATCPKLHSLRCTLSSSCEHHHLCS